ncbi:hypothetical protein V1517DRAFT_324218 [Lipomyces orientalis]|uniref:Uncharacterized protein n=1 Tax=Lipomyces orientalis TaxID=1233043 RepID=A0ACC3TLZ3_9ASCO
MDIWRHYKSPETRLLRRISHLQESRINRNFSDNEVTSVASSTSSWKSFIWHKKPFTPDGDFSRVEKGAAVREVIECDDSFNRAEGSTSAKSTVDRNSNAGTADAAGGSIGSSENTTPATFTEGRNPVLREMNVSTMDAGSQTTQTDVNKFNPEYIHNGNDSKTDKLQTSSSSRMHQGSVRETALSNITNSDRGLSDQKQTGGRPMFDLTNYKLHEAEDNLGEFACKPLFIYDYGSSDPRTPAHSRQPSIEELLNMFPKLTRGDLEDDLASNFLFPLPHMHSSLLLGKQVPCERCRQSIEYLMSTYEKYIALFTDRADSWQSKSWGHQFFCATDDRELAAQMARAECRIALVYP